MHAVEETIKFDGYDRSTCTGSNKIDSSCTVQRKGLARLIAVMLWANNIHINYCRYGKTGHWEHQVPEGTSPGNPFEKK